jgi:hypothetical protein
MSPDFFESADWSAIETITSAGTEESYIVEFKRKSSTSEIELAKEDRRLLGEALSGFANATGGLLIIGIGTRQDNGIDRAASLHPISNVQAVAERYRAYANDCVSPPVDGLRVRAISNGNGSGVIVIAVPKGQARPHMSTAPSHHTYYRRLVSSFVPMQSYEVEEMMRLKTAPKLTFVYRLQSAGSMGSNRNFVIVFGLRNESKVTAKLPYIAYLDGPNQPRVAQYGLDGNGNTLWRKISTGASSASIFAADAGQVIHPGQEFFVSKLDFIDVYDRQFSRDWGISQLSPGENLTLRFEFGCEDCPKELVELSFTADELRAAE